MRGITACGAWIPRARLNRSAIADANAWFDPGLQTLAKGERSICNWDEDTITMAVEAGQDCLAALGGPPPDALYLASTTFPFLDRQNAVVVAEALNLGAELRTLDAGGSQRAATSALIAMLEGSGNGLLIASEHRRSRAGSRSEMLWGDAAASLAVGADKVLAEVVGVQSRAVDFVDHYRAATADFDYGWEERWIRDEGFMKVVPAAVNALLEVHAIDAGTINHFIVPTEQSRTALALAKKLGIEPGALVDNQIASVGVAGAAQPVLLLAKVLETAAPRELILVTGFGQGCDAILLRTTDAIGAFRPATGVSGALARRREESNYNKFLSFNDLVERDIGKRGEVDRQTWLSGYERRRDLLNSFVGGKCRECGTLQIPRERYCVNPDCKALDSQDPCSFADRQGTVTSWTADRLTFDWNPPAWFGMVAFDGGGKLMMDFTEVPAEGIESGARVSVHFRIRQFDRQRGFRKYFWKASPC